MSSIIESLQTSQLLWHAGDTGPNCDEPLPSGYALLDEKLAGGWPDKGIIELKAEHIGIGEVRLLLPALKSLQQPQVRRLYLWVAPPGKLNGQALQAAGLPLADTLAAIDVDSDEAFWITERSLRSGCCAAVVLWCDELTPTQARRLQLAAKEGGCLGVLIRPPGRIEQSLPLSLRMHIKACRQGLAVDIVKRLGSYPVAPFELDMSRYWPQLCQTSHSQKPHRLQRRGEPH